MPPLPLTPRVGLRDVIKNILVQADEILAHRRQEGKRTGEGLRQVPQLELGVPVLVVRLHDLGDDNVVGPDTGWHVRIVKENGGIEVRAIGLDRMGVKEDILDDQLTLLVPPNNLGLRFLGEIGIEYAPTIRMPRRVPPVAVEVLEDLHVGLFEPRSQEGPRRGHSRRRRRPGRVTEVTDTKVTSGLVTWSPLRSGSGAARPAGSGGKVGTARRGGTDHRKAGRSRNCRLRLCPAGTSASVSSTTSALNSR